MTAAPADDIFRPYKATLTSEPYYIGPGGHKQGHPADEITVGDTVLVMDEPDDDGDVTARAANGLTYSLNIETFEAVVTEPEDDLPPLSIDMLPDILKDTRTVKVSTITQVLIDSGAFSPFGAESIVATALVRESLDGDAI
jgi:hypothetical protein